MTVSSDRRFAIFILTHGRPDKVVTWTALRNAGWDGDTYLVCDDEDPTLDQYRERFGAERVLVFSKAEVARTFDEADNRGDRRTVVYARNACWGFARDLGLTHFLELDDDYTIFLFRWLSRERSVRGAYRGIPTGLILSSPIIKRTFRRTIEATLDLLDATGAMCVAWSQGGDHAGGAMGGSAVRQMSYRFHARRKAMNVLFVRTDRPFSWVGRINEDVNTYVTGGMRGDLFLTIFGIQVNQLGSQSQAGGMTDVYLASGTYVKSFFTVMMAPSCVTVRLHRFRVDSRYHHRIDWGRAIPKIISGSWRKPREGVS
jgi:hypothetical protein